MQKRKASLDRIKELKEKIDTLKLDENDLRKKWEEEKNINLKINKKKEELENSKFKLEQAENNYDLESAARLRHGIIPTLEKEIEELKQIL